MAILAALFALGSQVRRQDPDDRAGLGDHAPLRSRPGRPPDCCCSGSRSDRHLDGPAGRRPGAGRRRRSCSCSSRPGHRPGVGHPSGHADRRRSSCPASSAPSRWPSRRATTAGPGRIAAWRSARGYPLTVLLAVPARLPRRPGRLAQGPSLAHRWTDAHVPIVVKPGAYDEVAADLDARSARPASTSTAAGGAADDVRAGALAGGGRRRRVGASSCPTGWSSCTGPDLDILIYPMDLLISGARREGDRAARAAMASRLTTTGGAPDHHAPRRRRIEDRLTAWLAIAR